MSSSNNAGIQRSHDFYASDSEILGARSVRQTNIVGTLLMTAALLPVLKQQPDSTIITTSSGLAVRADGDDRDRSGASHVAG
jgi:uncharacterized oxidoreductase